LNCSLFLVDDPGTGLQPHFGHLACKTSRQRKLPPIYPAFDDGAVPGFAGNQIIVHQATQRRSNGVPPDAVSLRQLLLGGEQVACPNLIAVE
jgi:hypothetical protein